MSRHPGGHLGAGTVLSGRLQTKGPFHVEGAVKGDIHCDDLVSVGASGTVEGTVHADRIEVDGGTVKGSLTAEHVEIRPNSTIEGAKLVSWVLRLDGPVQSEGATFEIGSPAKATTKATARRRRRSTGKSAGVQSPPPPD